jgi:hypothetical protein
VNVHNEEVKRFIREKSPLFWYIPENKKENISMEVLVEAILNHGSLDDVKKIFQLIGIEKVAEIFYDSINNKKRNNYYPTVINFFNLYFKRHVH